MGSDLYISIETQRPGNAWSKLFEGPSTDLARGVVVDAFGTSKQSMQPDSKTLGYVAHTERDAMAAYAATPWLNDEPYWVRLIPGQTFVDIVRERRWRLLQDGDFHDTECSEELRGFAVMVDNMMDNGLDVRVWCWHSQ